MDIIKEIEKELNKIEQGVLSDLSQVKLTSDLGKKVIENVVKSLLNDSSLKLKNIP
jgi:ethanolamine utilization protein EutQ (cupin superfamily)